MLRSWILHWPQPDIGDYAKRERERTRWVLLRPDATWASAGAPDLAWVVTLTAAPQSSWVSILHKGPPPTTLSLHMYATLTRAT